MTRGSLLTPLSVPLAVEVMWRVRAGLRREKGWHLCMVHASLSWKFPWGEDCKGFPVLNHSTWINSGPRSWERRNRWSRTMVKGLQNHPQTSLDVGYHYVTWRLPQKWNGCLVLVPPSMRHCWGNAYLMESICISHSNIPKQTTPYHTSSGCALQRFLGHNT